MNGEAQEAISQQVSNREAAVQGLQEALMSTDKEASVDIKVSICILQIGSSCNNCS